MNTSPRLDEVPVLAGRAEDFHGLYIDDVIIKPAKIKDETVGWMASIILVNDTGLGWPQPVIWAIGLRDTEALARDAAVALLDGLLAGKERALELHPEDIPDIATIDAMKRSVGDAVDQWNRRRNEQLARQVDYLRRRKLDDVPPPEVVAWGGLVRETRKRWGWKQKELARKVGLDAPRLSKRTASLTRRWR